MLCHHFYSHILCIVKFGSDFQGWTRGIPTWNKYGCKLAFKTKELELELAIRSLRILQFFNFNIATVTIWGSWSRWHRTTRMIWYAKSHWNINNFVHPLMYSYVIVISKLLSRKLNTVYQANITLFHTPSTLWTSPLFSLQPATYKGCC